MDKEQGSSLVEYALLLALIAIVCMFTVQLLGGVIANRFGMVADCMFSNQCTNR